MGRKGVELMDGTLMPRIWSWQSPSTRTADYPKFQTAGSRLCYKSHFKLFVVDLSTERAPVFETPLHFRHGVRVVGITNSIDKAGVAAAVKGTAEMPRSMILEDQFFCVCKARKGEGDNIPVRRVFRYQRFISKPKD
jgi:hypothetical protein